MLIVHVIEWDLPGEKRAQIRACATTRTCAIVAAERFAEQVGWKGDGLGTRRKTFPSLRDAHRAWKERTGA